MATFPPPLRASSLLEAAYKPIHFYVSTCLKPNPILSKYPLVQGPECFQTSSLATSNCFIPTLVFSLCIIFFSMCGRRILGFLFFSLCIIFFLCLEEYFGFFFVYNFFLCLEEYWIFPLGIIFVLLVSILDFSGTKIYDYRVHKFPTSLEITLELLVCTENYDLVQAGNIFIRSLVCSAATNFGCRSLNFLLEFKEKEKVEDQSWSSYNGGFQKRSMRYNSWSKDQAFVLIMGCYRHILYSASYTRDHYICRVISRERIETSCNSSFKI